VHTPKRSNRPTVQPKTQASIDDQHSEAILGKLGEKSRLELSGPVRESLGGRKERLFPNAPHPTHDLSRER
jgi:hypothetical protein